jgi:hypothetical protein
MSSFKENQICLKKEQYYENTYKTIDAMLDKLKLSKDYPANKNASIDDVLNKLFSYANDDNDENVVNDDEKEIISKFLSQNNKFIQTCISNLKKTSLETISDKQKESFSILLNELNKLPENFLYIQLIASIDALEKNMNETEKNINTGGGVDGNRDDNRVTNYQPGNNQRNIRVSRFDIWALIILIVGIVLLIIAFIYFTYSIRQLTEYDINELPQAVQQEIRSVIDENSNISNFVSYIIANITGTINRSITFTMNRITEVLTSELRSVMDRTVVEATNLCSNPISSTTGTFMGDMIRYANAYFNPTSTANCILQHTSSRTREEFVNILTRLDRLINMTGTMQEQFMGFTTYGIRMVQSSLAYFAYRFGYSAIQQPYLALENGDGDSDRDNRNNNKNNKRTGGKKSKKNKIIKNKSRKNKKNKSKKNKK